MIVVSTADFELYHDVVNELRDRGVTFTTVRPETDLPDATSVVIVADDDPRPADVKVVVAGTGQPRAAVTAALTVARGDAGQVVVGVDPGSRPGIAVLHGDAVVAVFQVPLEDAASVIRDEVSDQPDAVVRIGDGARLRGSRLIDDLADVRVELVDETGTTPHLGQGTRGMGDVLAAVNIARREGDVVEERPVEPTAGEIQTIKTESRERSPQNREITAALARKVARGELSLEDAIEEHDGE